MLQQYVPKQNKLHHGVWYLSHPERSNSLVEPRKSEDLFHSVAHIHLARIFITNREVSAHQSSLIVKNGSTICISFLSEPKTNMQVYLSYMPMTQAPLTIQPKKLLDVSLTGTTETRSLQVELSSKTGIHKGGS